VESVSVRQTSANSGPWEQLPLAQPTVQTQAANPDALEFMKAQILRTQPMGYFGCVAVFMSLDFAKEAFKT
jgi:hypothetical protein